MDTQGAIREKLARVEERTEFIKELLLEQKDVMERLEQMLSHHIEDDGENFDKLRTQLTIQDTFVSRIKGSWSAIVVIVMVIWEVGKELIHFYAGS